MHIIIPKRLPDLNGLKDLPRFYLAGPIRGGGDWQREMALEIQKQTGDQCVIICPCRWTNEHPLAEYFLEGDEHSFPHQLNWERHFLAYAGWQGNRGCVVFWLGAQREPRDPEAGPYGRDTYGELGEWRGRLLYNENLHVVIGGEKDFSGIDMIERNFSLAMAFDYFFPSTMEETVKEAVAVARVK